MHFKTEVRDRSFYYYSTLEEHAEKCANLQRKQYATQMMKKLS